MKHASVVNTIAVAGLALVILAATGCSGGGNDGANLTLTGTYQRAGIMDIAQNQSWAALGEAEYSSIGTGTLKYAHSAFGPIEGLSIAYGLSENGTLDETITMPGAAGETTNGAVTNDKRVMVVIDDDEDDDLVGLEVGIHLTSENVGPDGNQFFYMGYRAQAQGAETETYSGIAVFNSDGSGQVIGNNVAQDFTYTRGGQGKLTITNLFVGGQGAMTADKTVMALADNNATDNIVGLQIGIKKSSGMSVSDLKGTYHLFFLSSRGDGHADTAVADFDGAGNLTLSDFIHLQTLSGTYTISAEGALEIVTTLASWQGAVRENGKFFAATDTVQPYVSMILGVAQW